MGASRDATRRFHYDPDTHDTYLEQFGIEHPTLRSEEEPE